MQDSTQERPSRFKGSYLEMFYQEVAAENGFLNKDGLGDYNITLYEGELGDQILKEGITITNENAIFYYPDFLIDEYKEYTKQKKIDDDKAKKENLKRQKNDAISKGNNSWISENKQDYIDKFEKKFSEYEETIQALYTSVRMVEENFQI